MFAVRNLVLLTLACGLGLPHLVLAQPPSRDLIIRDGPRPLTPPSINPRLGSAKENEIMLEDARRWLAGLGVRPKQPDIDPKLLKDLMDKFSKDKASQQQIEDWLKENPKFRDPEFLKQLSKMREAPDFPKNLEGKVPPDVRPPIENEQAFKDNVEQVIDSGQKPIFPERGPYGAPPKGDPQPSGPSPSPDSNPGNPGDNEWVKWMQKNFGDSDAGKSAVKDLMSALEKQNSKGMFDNIPEFKNGGWKDFDSWGKANAGDLWKMKPPDMSGAKMTPPKMGGTSSGSGSSLGSGGGGSGGGLGGAGGGIGSAATPLVVIAAIAAAIFLAVLLLRKWKFNREQLAVGALAGKDGIDFDSIRTREQLVVAFDHVSLDQIGEEARTWNHRVIADEFAESRPVYAEPANELAGLYERARYAPLDEDLTHGEFADARRDLRTIAGVTP